MNEPVRIYLVRHGETAGNVDGVIQGHGDSPLTEVGRRQSLAAGAALGRIGIGALYCSDLGRAAETGAVIGRLTGCEPLPDTLLREQHLGEWEGMPWRQVKESYPDEMRRRVSDGWDYTPPGGESRLDQVLRLREFCLRAFERHAGSRIGAISHGGTIGLFFRWIWRVPFGDHRFPFKCDNCSISTVESGAEGVRLVSFNEVLHLGNGVAPCPAERAPGSRA